MKKDDEKRLGLLQELRPFIYDSFAYAQDEEAKHMLLFDLRDQLGRTAFRLILEHPPNEELRKMHQTSDNPGTRFFQSVFATETVFRNLAKDAVPDANIPFQSGMFGVLLFAYGGVLLSMLPSPLLGDGQHRVN